ncbi:MAG: metallophosphoesterase family protein [Thermodesulfobacteriota bacterium]|nr:metallophosphoesterase family protein [Thermodesulfobacteriota bacterium]
MRIAVISDIHSNFEAFEAVLKHIKKAGVDEVISLGDNIGYGADPEEVIRLLCKNSIDSVLGNHELALLNKRYLAGFNPTARAALIKNRKMLSKASSEYISYFKPFFVRFGCRFVHGLPPDSVSTYLSLTSETKLERIMAALSQKISFTGHTHLLGIVELQKHGLIRRKIKKNIERLDKESRYIINAGSIGQQRDGDARAKFVIWDSDAGTLEPVYIEYDKEAAAEKIRKAGISDRYAKILLKT